MKKAIANYNMQFDNGKFYKNKIYEYYKSKENQDIFIITETGTPQKLWKKDFEILFTLLKNTK